MRYQKLIVITGGQQLLAAKDRNEVMVQLAYSAHSFLDGGDSCLDQEQRGSWGGCHNETKKTLGALTFINF